MICRTASPLCAGRLSITTMSPGARVGTRHCRRYSRKIARVIARSMTKGAVMPSWRSPARKVRTFQCPQGTRPTRRAPRLARPRSRAMLVVVPVSSRKTSRAGSRSGCAAIQAARAAATSGRSCSLACTIFFKADAFGGKEPPYRAIADRLAAAGQLGADLLQRQVGNRGDPLQQPIPICLQARAVIAAHRLGGEPALLTPGVYPVNHRADCYLEQLRRTPPRQPALNRTDNPFP